MTGKEGENTVEVARFRDWLQFKAVGGEGRDGGVRGGETMVVEGLWWLWKGGAVAFVVVARRAWVCGSRWLLVWV